MRMIVNYILGLALVAAAFVSCKRQTIYDPELLTAKIPIVINWSESAVDESKINNVSLYFYPEGETSPIVFYSSDPYFATVKLHEGKYNIALHNEIEGNILGVDCFGSESFDDYKMNIQYDDASKYDMFYKPNADEQLIKESEAVGAWSYKEFDVTRDMIEYTRTRTFEDVITELQTKAQEQAKSTKASSSDFVESLTKSLSSVFVSADPATRAVTKSLEDLNGVRPQPRTATYKVFIDIQNMNNIQYIEGVIDGFVDGANVVSGEKIAAKAKNFTYMKMSEHTFDEGSTTDGTITYSFSNFGHLKGVSEERYTLTVNIIIHSGERYSETFDVTDQINNPVADGIIDVKIGDGYNNGTTDIVLPKNSGAGFGVDEWGEAEDVIL